MGISPRVPLCIPEKAAMLLLGHLGVTPVFKRGMDLLVCEFSFLSCKSCVAALETKLWLRKKGGNQTGFNLLA